MGLSRQILNAAMATALASLLIGDARSAHADPATLSIELGGQTRHFSAADLLANPATRTLEIPNDPAYGRSMRYQAVPLLELLRGLQGDNADTIEARASDGFVSQLPWKWEHPERSGVTSEQWPYALASLTGVSDPLRRWPQLSIVDRVPADDPSRRGQAVFLAQCLPCHRLYGAGEGDKGPDLGSPMPATAYLTQAGLKALLRNPAAVRNWPQRQMPSFDPDTLPDADIDAVIAYLTRIAEQQR